MNPHTHFLFPFLIGLILIKFGVLSWKLALLCGVVGVLVDLDHYVEHIVHSKSNKFSLISTWNNSARVHRFIQRSFIHGLKGALMLTLIFLFIVFFSWKVALILAIGYYSHLILDYIYLRKDKFLRWRFSGLYLKESYLEFFLDIILSLGIIGVILV